jgi:membrane associated rhomboid family serine protease
MKATKQTLGIMGLVFIGQFIATIMSLPTSSYFVLSTPILQNPWTIFSSVYSHAGIAHLLSNSIALLVFGYIVETMTNAKRFHLFFVTSGVIAGVSQVLLSVFISGSVGVLGASGAIFALMGYSIVGNNFADTLIDRLEIDMWKTIGLYVLIAVLVTYMTASPGVALFAHAIGFIVGAVAGHYQVLHTKDYVHPAT